MRASGFTQTYKCDSIKMLGIDKTIRELKENNNAPKMFPKAAKAGVCKIEDCDKQSTTRGMCDNHYAKWRRGTELYTKSGEPIEKFIKIQQLRKPCRVRDCETMSRSMGLCPKHYWQWRRGSQRLVDKTGVRIKAYVETLPLQTNK